MSYLPTPLTYHWILWGEVLPRINCIPPFIMRSPPGRASASASESAMHPNLREVRRIPGRSQTHSDSSQLEYQPEVPEEHLDSQGCTLGKLS